MPSPLYAPNVVFFQLHGYVISHVQVLAHPSEVCIILHTPFAGY